MEDIFVACFGNIQDPRVNRTKKHDFIAILAIAVLATLAGCLTQEDIWMFCIGHADWLQQC
mgnify:CR=1 FL=1